jgi:hypothetical protein
MAAIVPEDEDVTRLRRQRNLFATIAICSLASIGLSVPRKISNYRELKAVNAHVVELQASIVYTQQQIQTVENRIIGIQLEIRKQQAQ